MVRTSYVGGCGAIIVACVLATGTYAQQPPAPEPKKDRVGVAPYGMPITHEQVMQLIAGAHAEAERRHAARMATIVVVDNNGEIVYAEKADNANNAAIDIAWGKARSSARYGLPTDVFYQALQAGNLSESLALPGAQPQKGGIPIVWNGRIIGGVGVTGAFADNDVAIAQAGVAAIK